MKLQLLIISLLVLSSCGRGNPIISEESHSRSLDAWAFKWRIQNSKKIKSEFQGKKLRYFQNRKAMTPLLLPSNIQNQSLVLVSLAGEKTIHRARIILNEPSFFEIDMEVSSDHGRNIIFGWRQAWRLIHTHLGRLAAQSRVFGKLTWEVDGVSWEIPILPFPRTPIMKWTPIGRIEGIEGSLEGLKKWIQIGDDPFTLKGVFLVLSSNLNLQIDWKSKLSLKYEIESLRPRTKKSIQLDLNWAFIPIRWSSSAKVSGYIESKTNLWRLTDHVRSSWIGVYLNQTELKQMPLMPGADKTQTIKAWSEWKERWVTKDATYGRTFQSKERYREKINVKAGRRSSRGEIQWKEIPFRLFFLPDSISWEEALVWPRIELKEDFYLDSLMSCEKGKF